MDAAARAVNMSDEERRAAAMAALAKVFPQWDFAGFEATYAEGVDQMVITLRWFTIDPSEGLE